MRSEQRYDIVEADALRPTSAHAGYLYSEGYFSLLRSRLTMGGFAVTWAPTSRVHDTFAAVFPHVLNFDSILIGSNEPIHFSPDDVRARIREPHIKQYFDVAVVDIESLLAPYLQGPARTSIASASRNISKLDLNQDLFPRDEFSVPRR